MLYALVVMDLPLVDLCTSSCAPSATVEASIEGRRGMCVGGREGGFPAFWPMRVARVLGGSGLEHSSEARPFSSPAPTQDAAVPHGRRAG